jgi:YesN/AraC family two-component response regulator
MLNILIVDDEENARLGLTKLLACEGYLVASAGNGFEALTYLKRHPVDLVITDINMPEMNGLTFLRELSCLYPQLKVIMVTAYGGVESYLEAIDLGAFEYLNKPVRVTDLKAVIRKFFFSRGDRVEPTGNSAALS